MRCCICGCEIKEREINDARPFDEGVCCNSCLNKYVIPKRLRMIKKKKEDYTDHRVTIMY